MVLYFSLWKFNIAMKSGSFIDMLKDMLNYQRVDLGP
jgi:hypothetical protein